MLTLSIYYQVHLLLDVRCCRDEGPNFQMNYLFVVIYLLLVVVELALHGFRSYHSQSLNDVQKRLDQVVEHVLKRIEHQLLVVRCFEQMNELLVDGIQRLVLHGLDEHL